MFHLIVLAVFIRGFVFKFQFDVSEVLTASIFRNVAVKLTVLDGVISVVALNGRTQGHRNVELKQTLG